MKEIIKDVHLNGPTSNIKLIEKLEVAKLNIADCDGNTLLHHAAANRNTDVLSFLISEGMNCNIQNKNGDTALHMAVCTEEHEIVKFLIENGADTTISNNFGDTPVDLCDTSKIHILELLTQESTVLV